MSGAEKKIFKKSRLVIKKNKENLKHQLDDIRSHSSVVKLLLRNLLSLKFTLNITHTSLCWYNFKYKIFKNSLVSEVSLYYISLLLRPTVKMENIFYLHKKYCNIYILFYLVVACVGIIMNCSDV